MKRAILFANIVLTPTLLFAHPGGHSKKQQPHVFHEAMHSEADPDPQPDLSPYCDLNNDDAIDDNEMFGFELDENGKQITKARTIKNAKIMADQCLERRKQEAAEGGNSAFDMTVITPGKLNFKPGELALTVDDGPTHGITEKVLKVLAKYNVKATFFIVGNRLMQNRSLVAEMIRQGHIIGNHTFSHAVTTDPAKITKEIISGLDAFEQFLNTKEGRGVLRDKNGMPRFENILFRPPGLGWKSAEAVMLNANNTTRHLVGPIHATIGTDAPNADWSCWAKKLSVEKCANAYYNDIMKKGRGIILSHDINSKTPQMLDILLYRLHTEGGGIKNLDKDGVWSFVRIDNRKELGSLESKEHDEFIELLSDEGI